MNDSNKRGDDADLLRALVEHAPDAMIFADRDGKIRLWNRGAERIFGYGAAEVLGGDLDVIVPERLRAAHWAGFRAAIESGQPKYEQGRVLTTRSAHKDGSRLYVDLAFALIRDGAGTVIGALATARDCTARYLEQREMQSRLSTLEARDAEGG